MTCDDDLYLEEEQTVTTIAHFQVGAWDNTGFWKFKCFLYCMAHCITELFLVCFRELLVWSYCFLYSLTDEILTMSRELGSGEVHCSHKQLIQLASKWFQGSNKSYNDKSIEIRLIGIDFASYFDYQLIVVKVIFLSQKHPACFLYHLGWLILSDTD